MGKFGTYAAAGELDGTEIIVIKQGANTVRLTLADLYAAFGTSPVQTLAQVLQAGNLTNGYAIQVGDKNTAYLKNSPGTDQLISDADNGLQANDTAGGASINFNQRKLYNADGAVVLDYNTDFINLPERTGSIDLDAGPHLINQPGLYKLVDYGNPLSYPDASQFDGKSITVINPFSVAAVISHSNGFAPLDAAGNDLEKISGYSVIQVKSVGGVWTVVAVYRNGETTATLDLNISDQNITGPGTYEVISDGGNGINKLVWPDPSLTPGGAITLIETERDDAYFSAVNDFYPYKIGLAVRYYLITGGSMAIYKSINGKWRGGYLTQ